MQLGGLPHACAHKPHVLPTPHDPEMQSASARHPLLTAQWAAQDPPQSVSVSSPSFALLWQVSAGSKQGAGKTWGSGTNFPLPFLSPLCCSVGNIAQAGLSDEAAKAAAEKRDFRLLPYPSLGNFPATKDASLRKIAPPKPHLPRS